MVPDTKKKKNYNKKKNILSAVINAPVHFPFSFPKGTYSRKQVYVFIYMYAKSLKIFIHVLAEKKRPKHVNVM